ncbi:MAG: FecR family protein [Kofleriaceae bacterium]
MTGLWSRHVAPHRWADAWAGRVEEAERADMERHAEKCPRCARARARIHRASDSFAAIRTQSSPDLPWDSVRARVHWSVSTERRQTGQHRRQSRRRPLGWAALALAGAGAVAAAVAIDPLRLWSGEPAAVGPAPAAQVVPAPPVAPAALAGLVNRATGEVMIDGVRPRDLFARRLGAGTVIATGDGRVDVQFGQASAFALGARSMVELRAFDASTIELVVEGTIDVEVAPRHGDQRFLVRAGERIIEVRGTQFRVRHDARSTSVACRHGLVVVRDARGRAEVGAARGIEIAEDREVSADRVVPLSVDEITSLVDATPMKLPVWNLDALLEGSAPLELATAGRREVRVDGVELGLAPMRVRVMPGRHTVEATDSAGRFRRAGWIDVAAPTGAEATPARLEIPAEPPRTRDATERRRQLQAGIDRARLGRCTRSIAKAGLTGTYVHIELAVDAGGAVGFLNVIDTDLPSATARCVRDVLADVRFRPGASATWRERIDL